MSEQLNEAVAHEAFHDRVKKLEPGEVARMKDGTAVKRALTEDGRDGYRVGRPSSYGGDNGGLYWDGAHHRTSEDAVRAAFLSSASSRDPDSLGGSQRFSRWMPLLHGGRRVRMSTIDLQGRPVVVDGDSADLTATGTPVSWLALQPARRDSASLTESVEEMAHEKTIGSKGKGLFGMKGAQLPAYIQHVYNDLVEGGKPTGSSTYRLAVGIVKNWARGTDGKKGKVSAETVAKARAAIAEWEKLKAKAKVTEEQLFEAALRAPKPPPLRQSNAARPGDADYHAPMPKPAKSSSSSSSKGSSNSNTGFNSKHRRAPAGTPMGGKFIQMGSSGADVQAVKRGLGVQNSSPQFGYNLKASVEAFQRKHGLTVDGIVGHQTALALAGEMHKARAATPGELQAGDRKLIRQRHQPRGGSSRSGRSRSRSGRSNGSMYGAGLKRSSGGVVVESEPFWLPPLEG